MRKPPENSRRCCCVRPGPASKAAPTRSCATSSPSACSVCPAISGSTRTCRSTRYRPREELEKHDLILRSGVFAASRRMDNIMVRDGARAPPHHEDETLSRDFKLERFAMNFDDTPQEAAFRAEARQWIGANAPKEFEAELSKSSLGRIRLQKAEIVDVGKAWQKKKAEAGWACLHWPKEYGGRGASPIERVIWQQEEGAFGKLSAMFIIGHGMCGPTMMAYAGEEQKRNYLPPLASGEKIWCQLFSEPAGGSDVAGLRTRAARKGDDWIINGQKIWTSGAHYSDYGILLTRTDPNVPKHKGLTMFFLDMKSPGVEVRPIKQANGQSDFNEVYFTDVKIPDSQRLGAINDGWNVSLTTLMNERMSIGAGVATGFPELFEFCNNLMLEDGPAIEDRNVRSKLANWAVKASGLKYTSMRTISALSKGERPGPENSIGKLVAGSMVQEVAMYALDLQGTAEIMRNIIAERVLGLPGDIRVDKDVPFNKIPTKGRA